MPPPDADGLQRVFVTTRWSVVLAAQGDASPASDAALEAICRSYWHPLYVLVRRQGHSPHDAQDLTQEFFARLVQKEYLKAASKERGRLRTFLWVALKRFLANEWDHTRAQKRGGGRTRISFDAACAEERYQQQPEAVPTERVYERQWAMTLLEQTMGHLRAEYAGAARESEFDQLKGCLTAERGSIRYEDIAAKLKMSEGAARVAVHRLRKRFRELFRAAVADTVDDASEVDDELRYIAKALAES